MSTLPDRLDGSWLLVATEDEIVVVDGRVVGCVGRSVAAFHRSGRERENLVQQLRPYHGTAFVVDEISMVGPIRGFGTSGSRRRPSQRLQYAAAGEDAG